MAEEGMRPGRKKKFFIIGGVLLVLVAAIAAFAVWKYVILDKTSREPDAKTIIAEVNRLYQLPAEGEPSVARVQKKDKIAKEPFFKNAKIGDYVLIHPEAERIFLYRRSEHRLINVMQFTPQNQNQPRQ